MIEVPHAIRSRVVEAMNDFLETRDSSVDSDAVAEALVEALEAASNEVGSLDEDLLALLDSETSGSKGLLEVLSDSIDNNPKSLKSGESMVRLLERIAEIDWLGVGDESEGFFTDADDLGEMDEY